MIPVRDHKETGANPGFAMEGIWANLFDKGDSFLQQNILSAQYFFGRWINRDIDLHPFSLCGCAVGVKDAVAGKG